MNELKTAPVIDPHILADLEAVCAARGIIRDSELARRVAERADRVRQETLERFGVQEIGAGIIRSMRGDR